VETGLYYAVGRRAWVERSSPSVCLFVRSITHRVRTDAVLLLSLTFDLSTSDHVTSRISISRSFPISSLSTFSFSELCCGQTNRRTGTLYPCTPTDRVEIVKRDLVSLYYYYCTGVHFPVRQLIVIVHSRFPATDVAMTYTGIASLQAAYHWKYICL